MHVDEVRFLFEYDRWATPRVLGVLDGLDPDVWARTHVVDERGPDTARVPPGTSSSVPLL